MSRSTKSKSFRLFLRSLMLWVLFWGLGALSVRGQIQTGPNCPSLGTPNFETHIVAGNRDCGTPGIFSIRWTNYSPGIEEVRYIVHDGEDNWRAEVVAAAPAAVVKIPIPASVKYFSYYAAFKCGSSSEDYSSGYASSMRALPAEEIKLVTGSTPTGNGTMSIGSIWAKLEGPTGFPQATFRLYKRSDLNTVIASQRTPRPYDGVTFFNLPAGDYVVKVDAKPECTLTSTAANWVNDHYELSAEVTVHPFTLVPTLINPRGTCLGGIKLEVSKALGVETIDYAVASADAPDTPLQTYTATYPYFTHTFFGLPGEKKYIVTATEKTGNVAVKDTFNLLPDEPELWAGSEHGTLPGAGEGAANLVLKGTSAACPVKYTITRVSEEGDFPPIVKENVTEERLLVEGLAAGSYNVKAEYGGIVRVKNYAFTIHTEYTGASLDKTVSARGICDPSGGAKWELRYGGHYAPFKVRVFNKESESLVREFLLPAGARRFETNNLLPGNYRLTLSNEAETYTDSKDFTIGLNGDFRWERGLNVAYHHMVMDFCREKAITRIPVNFIGDGGIENDPVYQAFLDGASYEIYKPDGKTFVYSGSMPGLTGNSISYLESPEVKSGYKLLVKSACGYPVLRYDLDGDDFRFSYTTAFRGCGDLGTDVFLSVADAQHGVVPKLTYRVKDLRTGALVTEYAMKAETARSPLVGMQPGDYLVEWFPQCAPSQIHKDTIHVDNKLHALEVSATPAVCADNGAISIYYNVLENIHAWRHELIRKHDGKLVAVYGSTRDEKISADFKGLAAGDYIVKTTPIVECNEMVPAVTEVTVPTGELTDEFIPKNPEVIRKAELGDPVGEVRYRVSSRVESVKWKVFDVVTGKEINKGEFSPLNEGSPNVYTSFRVDQLPQTYRIEFTLPCGKITRIDDIPLKEGVELPGFDVIQFAGIEFETCHKLPTITVKSKLKTAGFPDKPTKIVLYKVGFEDGKYVQNPIDSVTNLTSIIETHTFTLKNAENYDRYEVHYYYNGVSKVSSFEKERMQGDYFYIRGSGSDFNLKGLGTLTVEAPMADPGTKMRLTVTDSNTDEVLFNDVVPADEPFHMTVKRANRNVTYHVEMLDGCYAGKTDWNRVSFYGGSGSDGSNTFDFELKANDMQCSNDGVITMIVPKAFRDVDQIHFTLTKISGTPYTDQTETATPAVPKSFIGLVAGTYKVTARATLFKDENGEPKVFEGEKEVTLYSNYSPLEARVSPDIMWPAFRECPNGRIGLNLSGGSWKYRVFLKSTPAGVLNPTQEIFTEPGHDSRLWGKGLAPGHYSLTVSDGCMERDVPDVEILEIPNTPLFDWYSEMEISNGILNKVGDTRDSLWFTLRFNPSQYPERFRRLAYSAYEVQIVPKGEQPDEKNWIANWSADDRGRSTISGLVKRFNNCNGIDVLFRLKDCHDVVTRFSSNNKVRNPFRGNWTQLKCNTVQWAFTDGEIGHAYNIKVIRGSDGAVLVNKDITYHSREEYLQRSSELEFPAESAYRIEVTPKDYCGSTMSESSQRVNRIYYLDENLGRDIFSDCDGRLMEFRAWTDCRLPMKYYIYGVNGTQETLITESDYIEVRRFWSCPYKFMKDESYVLYAVEYGQPEANKVELLRFTLNYRLPSGYRVDSRNTFSARSFCGAGYNAVNGYWSESLEFGLAATWEGVPPVEQRHFRTIPKMKIVATQKAAPHRKFVASVSRGWESVGIEKWKELLENGKLSEHYAYLPEGEYEMMAQTVCGNIPLADDYLGRPTIDLSASKVEVACDGKFTITPKGTVTYRGSTETVEITSFYMDVNNATTHNWGESFETYERNFDLILNIRRKSDGLTCTMRWPFSLNDYILSFDQSQTVSLFCSDSGKGIIHMALKGGKPPYTYTLSTLDGTVLESKTSAGAVDFLHGALGQRYRITASDACALTRIYQDVLLQDPAVVSSTMVERKSYCVGDHVKMAARFFPGATYLWHLPDGTTHEGREIEFEARTESAGLYKVDIRLTTCTVTLYANITVRIVSIQEAQPTSQSKQSCAGEVVTFVLDPAIAQVDGRDALSGDIEYQWETTTTPNDESTWKPIAGATSSELHYTAPKVGVYYVRRTARVDECVALGAPSKLEVVPGIRVTITPEEQKVTVFNKEPFTLTAGLVTGNPNRTYLWQRSLDKKTWEDVGNGETYTEKQPQGYLVYYRRIVSAGTCRIEGQSITVRFKKRAPAYINPFLRQRTLDI